jgi:glycosyltransferase involved in cell wall biosynthesis
MGKLNPNVVILPNYLPESTLDVAMESRYEGSDRGGVVIGWGGSSTHLYDWSEVAYRPILHTMKTHPHTRVRFLGTPYDTGLPRDRVEKLQWVRDMNVHYGRVGNFDIGLAPLVNNKFNKAKSWLKMAEHMMCGVPAVCSPLPDYKRLVDHGRTGFIAKNEKEWCAVLDELVRDEELRMLVGQQARKFAADNLTIEANVHKWEDAYRSLL